MTWKDLDPGVAGDKIKLLNCVVHAARGAKEHEKKFGKTPAQHVDARNKICDKIKAGYQVVMHCDDCDGYTKGYEVGLFFQKMKWLSQFAKPSLGDMWVVSVAFEDGKFLKKASQGGKKADYFKFLDMLNKKSSANGPLHTFMEQQKIDRLFSVGAVGADDKKEIAWLEWVATTDWVPANGKWSVTSQTIDGSYKGSNGKFIPAGVLDHWGTGGKFQLHQGKFTP